MQCEVALDTLMMSSESLDTVLLAYRDGRPYLFKSRSRQNSGKLAAMIGSLVALSQTILKETSEDGLDLAVLEGAKSKLVTTRITAGDGLLVLAALAGSSVSLGRLLNDTRACATRVAAAFPPR
jgi:predicted regulator of Ras-like GTPase activity (Roadblock/LC7/MglB family)